MIETQEILQEEEKFITLVIERLGSAACDFGNRIGDFKRAGEGQAGVLLPLFFRPSPDSSPQEGEFFFYLCKRSLAVSQAGDLSCPGGFLRPGLDRFLSLFLRLGAPPLTFGRPYRLARNRGRKTFGAIALFLAAAARESWEEIGLSPGNVSFLGPLPTYRLKLFKRTIFPLVGLVKKPWEIALSREVERVIQVPLRAFLVPENFARIRFEGIEEKYLPSWGSGEFPCFVIDDCGKEEILWGATYHLIAGFMGSVLGHKFPENGGRIIRRALSPHYAAGRKAALRDGSNNE